MTTTERIDRIARKIEDPLTCEWIEIGDPEYSVRVKVSKLGFWERVYHPESGSKRDHLACEDAPTAGWLIECLWNAGYLTKLGYSTVWVQYFDDGVERLTVPVPISGGKLEAVLSAIEEALKL